MVNNNLSEPYDVEILTLGTSTCFNPVCEVAPRQSLVQQVTGSPLKSASSILNTSWANTRNEIAVSALIAPDENMDEWVIKFDFDEAGSVVNVETENLTNTNHANPPDRHKAYMTWSPEDSQIMYMAWDYLCQPQRANKRGYNLIIRNVDGTDFLEACEEKMIVEGGGYPGAQAPNWWRGPR